MSTAREKSGISLWFRRKSQGRRALYYCLTWLRGQVVTIVTQNEGQLKECPAVLSGDPTQRKQGLVVLQEWWGVNEHIKAKAVDIAHRGNFVTIIPDLYRGKVATNHEEAGHYYGDLNWPAAVEDVRACAAYLKSQGCTKVGATGFCMGGALALAGGVLHPDIIDAAAPFYGICNDKLCNVATMRIPLQLNFGKLDTVKGFSSPADVEVLLAKLDGAGVPYELNMFDAGHGFTNPSNPSYSAEIANESLNRLVTFMQACLK